MSQLFNDFLLFEFEKATSKTKKEISILQAEAARTNNLNSDRRWIYLQECFFENLSDYSTVLKDNLTLHDSKHSPITKSDFKAAKASLEEFKTWCETHFEGMRERSKLFSYNSTPLNPKTLKDTFDRGINLIERHEYEFKSKRSLFRKVLGMASEKFWGIIIGATFSIITLISWVLLNN